MKLTVLSAASKQQSRFAKPNHLKTREGQQFAPLWRVWAERLKAFNVPALDARPQVFSIKDRKKRRWKPAHLLLLEATQLFTLVSTDLNVPCIFRGVFQRDICQTNMANVRWPPFRLPLFRPLAGRGGFLRGFLFRWVLLHALTLTRSLTMHDATSCPWRILSMKVGAHMIPCRASFCTALWLHRNQSFMFVQEAPPAKDVDLTCNKTLPTKAITC